MCECPLNVSVYFWCGAKTSASSFLYPWFLPPCGQFFFPMESQFHCCKKMAFLDNSHAWYTDSGTNMETEMNWWEKYIHRQTQRDMRHRKRVGHKYTHWGEEIYTCIHWLDTESYDAQKERQTCCPFVPGLRSDLTSRGFQWKTSFCTLLLWFGPTHQSQLKSNHKKSHKEWCALTQHPVLHQLLVLYLAPVLYF